MPYLLRFTSWGLGINPFDPPQVDPLNWMNLPADFLDGFCHPVDDARLSTYRVETLDSADQINRIVAAFVATRPTNRSFDELGYVLLDEDVLMQARFTIDATLAETPDVTVNGWHRDIAEVSIGKLMTLFEMAWNGDTHESIPSITLKRIVRNNLDNLDFELTKALRNKKADFLKKLNA